MDDSQEDREMTTLLLRFRSRALVLLFMLPIFAGAVSAEEWFDKKSEWHGFDRLHFTIAERAAYVVVPKEAAQGNPWVWRARFPDYHFEMDVELLNHGFHIAYVDVGGMFGNSRAMNIGDQFYSFMTKERGLAARPALEGVSRGGLFVYNWTARHPEHVAGIYCDTPVLDFKSWPAGKGRGIGSAGAWQQCLAAYALTEEQALSFSNNPID
ncbi:MAG: alpha/beta hydrolase, partial [Fuerstiella sp.]